MNYRVSDERIEIQIAGAVQGVGFRPFVHRVALEFGISGWVRNSGDGVTIEAQGSRDNLELFQARIRNDAPPLAKILEFIIRCIPRKNLTEVDFEIIVSDGHKASSNIVITSDAGGCSECRSEVLDKANRRYGYALNTCTDCGPRYTIIRSLPYDRECTTLSSFPLCSNCLAEYEDLRSRRYHAETVSCKDCGPKIVLLDKSGQIKFNDSELAINAAREILIKGGVIATKSLGGFHLMANARDETAVKRLRQIKLRAHKPFAVMARTLTAARIFAAISPAEAHHLETVQRPIVLLSKINPEILAPSISPESRRIGVMLSPTPLHDFLLNDDLDCVVATSANETGGAIIFDDEAIKKFAASTGLDAILSHQRAIEIGIDDSVIITNSPASEARATLVRRGRGYAPFPITGILRSPTPLIAFGADLKNTFCLAAGTRLHVSPHIGDLGSGSTNSFFKRTVTHFERVLRVKPAYGVCDLHPSFWTTKEAEKEYGGSLMRVQHHHAHFASCLIDNAFDGPAVGIVLDGFGHGNDGMAWGGEFLVGTVATSDRRAHFSYVPMPGGDFCAREHDRMAVSYAVSASVNADDLEAVHHLNIRDPQSRELLIRLIDRINLGSSLGVMTSSAGRLIEAAAAIIGVSIKSNYEGEAAAKLEALLSPYDRIFKPYRFDICHGEIWTLNFLPLIQDLIKDVAMKRSQREMALRFHSTLAIGVAETATALAIRNGVKHVALSGGVFLNRFLLREISRMMAAKGLVVLSHNNLSPGDGGISAGQAACAIARINN